MARNDEEVAGAEVGESRGAKEAEEEEEEYGEDDPKMGGGRRSGREVGKGDNLQH